MNEGIITVNTLYVASGVLIFCMGVYGVITLPHLLKKMLALNIAGSGIFMVIVSLGYNSQTGLGDPVSHALVITGLVVSVSATALALKLICYFYKKSNATRLPEDQLP